MNKIYENIEPAPNSLGLDLDITPKLLEDKYLLYLAFEVYKYETSQGEITMGLINPLDQFERICVDFKIDCQNECTFIDYNQAKKIELSSFIVWDTKSSLYQFFKYNNIQSIIYFKQEDESKKKSWNLFMYKY